MGQTILLVDDDEGLLTLLKIMLERKGYAVFMSTNGEDALVVLSKLTPDLLIVDLMMPGMSGIELSAQIRATSKYAHLPILVLSANQNYELIQRCMDVGASEYMVKPITSQLLINTVQKLLN